MSKINLRNLGFFLVFIFSTILSYSQININYVFTKDSLKGFDEKSALIQMRQQVYDPGDYKGFMFLQKENI